MNRTELQVGVEAKVNGERPRSHCNQLLNLFFPCFTIMEKAFCLGCNDVRKSKCDVYVALWCLILATSDWRQGSSDWRQGCAVMSHPVLRHYHPTIGFLKISNYENSTFNNGVMG